MGWEMDRLIESRVKLQNAWMMAFGSYVEQEAKKLDQWRDQSIGQLYSHLQHELEEIKRNLKRRDKAFLLHNCMDAVMLATIMLAKVLESEKL
jgi:hypothetical protein